MISEDSAALLNQKMIVYQCGRCRRSPLGILRAFFRENAVETSSDALLPSHSSCLCAGVACERRTRAASAQDVNKAATEAWRPKDGLYGDPRKDLDGRCADDERLSVALNKKKVVGYEWTCDVTKVTNTTSNSMRLDMTCTDINLAQSLYPRDSAAEERPFKEVMLLDKIGEKTISIRKTSNGKFRGRPWRATYCPDEQQRAGEKSTPKPVAARAA